MRKETQRTEGGGAVQAERGGGRAGGGSAATDEDEWHQSEQLHHKNSAKQYEYSLNPYSSLFTDILQIKCLINESGK